jgi:hypothetical protein
MNRERNTTPNQRNKIVKNIQKFVVAAAVVASLVLGVIAAFADDSSKDNGADQPTTLLTRKVNEYEGQH